MLWGRNGLHSCAEVLIQLDDCLNVVVELSYEHDIAGEALGLALLMVAVNLVDEQPATWEKQSVVAAILWWSPTLHHMAL